MPIINNFTERNRKIYIKRVITLKTKLNYYAINHLEPEQNL